MKLDHSKIFYFSVTPYKMCRFVNTETEIMWSFYMGVFWTLFFFLLSPHQVKFLRPAWGEGWGGSRYSCTLHRSLGSYESMELASLEQQDEQVCPGLLPPFQYLHSIHSQCHLLPLLQQQMTEMTDSFSLTLSLSLSHRLVAADPPQSQYLVSQLEW